MMPSARRTTKWPRFWGWDIPAARSSINSPRRAMPAAIRFPRSRLNRQSLDFSFSGLKTSVLYHVRGYQGREREATNLTAAGDSRRGGVVSGGLRGRAGGENPPGGIERYSARERRHRRRRVRQQRTAKGNVEISTSGFLSADAILHGQCRDDRGSGGCSALGRKDQPIGSRCDSAQPIQPCIELKRHRRCRLVPPTDKRACSAGC